MSEKSVERSEALMKKVEESSLGKTLVMSLVIHVVVISLLSIGSFMLCAKYGTLDVSKAYLLEEEAMKEAQAQKKKEEAAKKKQEAEKNKPADKKTDPKKPDDKTGDKTESPVLKNLNETSKERPKNSTLNSLDDDFE